MLSSAQLTKKFLSTTSRQQPSKPRQRVRPVLLGKTAQVLICFMVLAALPCFVPRLNRYRVLMPSSLIKPPKRPSQPTATSTPGSASDSSRAAVHAQAETKIEAKPGEIEDASGEALNHFFAALRTTETAGGRVRVSHYGDSPITNDGITATVRRK